MIAGDVFGCRERIFRPWEFNFQYDSNGLTKQEPIRNILMPYFFYGVPLFLLKWLASIGAVSDFSSNLGNSTSEGILRVDTFTLIYFPRLFMALISIVIDICLLKTGLLFDLDQSSILKTFASSYLAIVYLTRTFSNSIETLLFAIFNYFVIKSLKFQKLKDKYSSVNQQAKKFKNDHESNTNVEQVIDSKAKNTDNDSLGKIIGNITFFNNRHILAS